MNNTIATDIAVKNTEKYSPLKNKPDLKTEKRRLYKAAKDMESLFMYQILKSMRQTIPKAYEDDKIGLGNDMGKDVYTQLFDQELATMMSGSSNKSIADMIYRSMEKALERQYGAKNESSSEIKDALPKPSYIKIKNEVSESPAIKIQKGKAVSREDALLKYDNIINRAAEKYGLQPTLLKSIIKTESAGNPRAVSAAGAKGLMQLADTTAADMGVNNVFSPHENIEGGAKYLRQMIDRFGDIKKALAAYNAGPETVTRYGDIPPYPETRRYVQTVLESLENETPDYK